MQSYPLLQFFLGFLFNDKENPLFAEKPLLTNRYFARFYHTLKVGMQLGNCKKNMVKRGENVEKTVFLLVGWRRKFRL